MSTATNTAGRRRGPKLPELALTDEERATLERWARRRNSAQALAVRCRIVVVYLGVNSPTDVVIGAIIGVTIPLVAFRLLAPNEVFPVAYRSGSSANLDVGGRRGQAIHRAL